MLQIGPSLAQITYNFRLYKSRNWKKVGKERRRPYFQLVCSFRLPYSMERDCLRVQSNKTEAFLYTAEWHDNKLLPFLLKFILIPSLLIYKVQLNTVWRFYPPSFNQIKCYLMWLRNAYFVGSLMLNKMPIVGWVK